MEFVRLGRSDIKISRHCLGTMTFGEQNDEAQAHDIMDHAFDAGITFFDTAELYSSPIRAETYGRTEEIVGTWLKKTGNRDKLVLASKVAGPGPSWIRGGEPINPAGIKKAIEGSLKRLQTDYIDLYQLHWPNRPHYHFGRYEVDFSVTDAEKEEESCLRILHALNDLIQEGKIRQIGLSDDTAWGTMKYLELAERHGLPRMASIQNEHSLLCRIAEPDLKEVCMMEDVSFLPWSPLATGILSGKYLGGQIPKGSRRDISGGKSHRDTPLTEAATKAYVTLAKEKELDPCQMALAFLQQQNFVASIIYGATSVEQLAINIGAKDVVLSQDVIEEIQKIYALYPRPFYSPQPEGHVIK
jgi:aryl-alcohol dehydrogenase-like predicted oxidoreductase